jgi:uncharacterized protein
MEKTANPAPLGLMGFGMTTVLLNIHNAGFFGMSSMVLAMGFCYGGIAQIIAGVLEFKKGNTFGLTAFTSYGLFWLSLVFTILIGFGMPTEKANMAWYLVMWGIFTLFMFFGTLRSNKALQFVFGSLTVLFFLLAIGDFAESETITKIAGWEGILCGLSSIYLAMAEVLEEQLGREVLPIGKPVAPPAKVA